MIYSKFKLFDRLPVDHQTYPLRGFEGISGPSKSTKYKYATTPYLSTNVDDHTYNNLNEVDKTPLMGTPCLNQKSNKIIRTSDPLSSALTTIRNAYYQSFETCYVSNSKLIQELLSKIVDIGYINSWYFTYPLRGSEGGSKQVDLVTTDKYKEPGIIINLKYYQNRPAIRGITQISKPGKRAYFSKQRLLKISELNN